MYTIVGKIINNKQILRYKICDGLHVRNFSIKMLY